MGRARSRRSLSAATEIELRDDLVPLNQHWPQTRLDCRLNIHLCVSHVADAICCETRIGMIQGSWLDVWVLSFGDIWVGSSRLPREMSTSSSEA